MTGDDHGNGGTAGPLRQLQARTARRAARSPTGSACAARPTSTRTPPIDRRAGRGVRERRASRSALHVTTNCDDWTRRRRSSPSTRDQLAALSRRTIPSLAGAGHQPHPLHRLERLGHAAEGRARATASASTRTTTTGRQTGCRTAPGMFTGSGMPMRFADLDGIDDRRLPGGDADDRRVGPVVPVHDRHAARPRARPRGLLRRLHREHAHRHRRASRARTRSSPPRRRAACRSSRPGRCSTGSTAATPRPSARSPGARTSSSSRSTTARAPTACGRWSRPPPRSAP